MDTSNNKCLDFTNVISKTLYEKISQKMDINIEKFIIEVESDVLTMTERQQTVFDLLYKKKLPKKEIVKLLMISRTRLYQIEKMIIKKLIIKIKYRNIISERKDKTINNSTLLSETDLSIRLNNCLYHYFGINATINDLLKFLDGNPKRILVIRNVGGKSLNELEVFLNKYKDNLTTAST